jgi:ArsR family transcriptional regulator, arsenate/arsenite/antimonite-responsive transcriptional repressor
MSGNILSEMETFFLALADKTRLRLLNLMREDEVCVCYFTEVLGVSQPKISRHLAYLRNAGIVSARREGKWMNYKIDMPEDSSAEIVLRDTLEWLKAQDDMRADYEKLAEVCFSAEAPVTIIRAPTPKTFVETHMNYQPREELETFLL